ncbi:MAG TPA: GTP-binding protein [Anaerolineae bacterium]|nr:GTP-binding protein [Anaerolineae bacterium]
MRNIKVALAGNPNSGKSTIFNALTGSRQHVGNWPGKTVEHKFGHFSHNGHRIEVTDLPGAYSLTAFSEEESITRDYILKEKADIVVAVVDASNLERNLYLVTQILELQARLILALNMSDKAEKLGYEIDMDDLSDLLAGVPVIRMVAIRGEGIEELRDTVVSFAEQLIGADTVST